jgi:hypothetical protein
MSKLKIAKIFPRKNLQSEDEFYKEFFTENKRWNIGLSRILII